MNLIDVLKIKFPNADFLSQIQVGDDGTGQRIVMWNYPAPKPQQRTIDGWMVDAVIQQEYDKIQKDIANQPILDSLKEIDLKSIRAIREGDEAIIAEYERQAVELRNQLI